MKRNIIDKTKNQNKSPDKDLKQPYLAVWDEGNKLLRCEQFFLINPSNESFDISCATDVSVKAIRLTGDIIKHLCSVFVSAGRDLSLNEQASEINNIGQLSTRTVQHDISTTCASCTAEELNILAYTLTFRSSVTIQRVLVHSRRCEQFVKEPDKPGYELRMVSNNESQVTRSNNFNISSVPRVYAWTEDLTAMHWVDNMSVVRRHLDSAPPVCKVEVFGDYACPDGQYGPLCSKACLCSGSGRMCHVATGLCLNSCKGSGCPNEFQPYMAEPTSPIHPGLVGVVLCVVVIAGVLAALPTAKRTVAGPDELQASSSKPSEYHRGGVKSVGPGSSGARSSVGRSSEFVTPSAEISFDLAEDDEYQQQARTSSIYIKHFVETNMSEIEIPGETLPSSYHTLYAHLKGGNIRDQTIVSESSESIGSHKSSSSRSSPRTSRLDSEKAENQ
ncbi:hypothetical protein ElyMa_001702800 [Elysia marginata]|uniref:DSL domain-containing protein n=1 Tax=Elysia marginata TaxID=1093978 RepID=A0AAV4JU95_9GAST|nr:hypothetical protein ElyMa_001702800 [Elysia marginata]